MNRNNEIQARLEAECSKRIGESLARLAASSQDTATLREESLQDVSRAHDGALHPAYSNWPYGADNVVYPATMATQAVLDNQPSVVNPKTCVHSIAMREACDECGRLAVRLCEECGNRLTLSGLHYNANAACSVAARIRRNGECNASSVELRFECNTRNNEGLHTKWNDLPDSKKTVVMRDSNGNVISGSGGTSDRCGAY